MNSKEISWDRRVAVGLGVVAIVAALALTAGAAERVVQDIEFNDVRQQTAEFHRYYGEIELTPEQEAVMREALEGLAAPCCHDKSAYTCCCECNMARSWWGLAKFLIARQGAGVEEVRDAVARWIEFIHPDGYSGMACYRGGCSRPFRNDGCGGMKEGEVIF